MTFDSSDSDCLSQICVARSVRYVLGAPGRRSEIRRRMRARGALGGQSSFLCLRDVRAARLRLDCRFFLLVHLLTLGSVNHLGISSLCALNASIFIPSNSSLCCAVLNKTC